MKFKVEKPKDNSWNLLRQAGYSQHPDRRHGISYFRSLQGGLYPRFHIYIDAESAGEYIDFSIHLDQKKPSYEGSRAHGGDYDSEMVQKEVERLREVFQHL